MLADDVMAWGRGWAVSRGTPEPVAVAGGFRIDVGLPHHRVRFVLHTWDDQALAAIDALAGPGYWLKVAGARDELGAALPASWRLESSNYLLGTSFSAAPVDPLPYAIELTETATVITAKAIASDGDIAATAYLALTGDIGVIDRVETAEAHRRRGLGRALMQTLSNSALSSGVSAGLLVATEDGRRLYEKLGWTMRAGIAAAWIPGPIQSPV
jgi:GNAT superfamily N-acetyltransferase